jgi:putative nucleotidyltransferase with HDIG domain
LDKHGLKFKLRQLERSFDAKLEEKCAELLMAAKRTLATLALTLETSDIYTAGHSRKVSAIATAIGKKMDLDKEQLDDLRWGGLLHDIGKVAIDRHIVNKPNKLTEEEYAHVMTHPLVGATIVDQIISSANLVSIIEYHHYFYNGHGYGQTVKGESIPLLARILAVADAYEAMTSLRPYRPNLSRENAIAEINRNSGSQFDPIVVSNFLKLSAMEITGGRNKTLLVRNELSDRLIFKSVLLNKYARAEWSKDLCT